MTPVDGIKTVKKGKTNKERTIILKEIKGKESPKKKIDKTFDRGEALKHKSKKNILWILVISFMVIIFIGWIFLFKANLLFPNTQEKSNGWQRIKSGFTQLFETFKKDVLKIKPVINSNQSGEDQIKELEEKVFPQFSNENKQ